MSDAAEDRSATGGSEHDLRTSSALFLSELERLRELELQKQTMAPGAELRVSTARQVEDLTLHLVTLSRYQTRLIELQERELAVPDPEVRPARVILEEWRAAERRLNDARSELERASDAADRLREEHKRTLRVQADVEEGGPA
jgi:hypothetical protein